MTTRVSCWVDLEEPYASKAKYAIEMLLHPFAAELVWTDGGACDLYYGRRGDVEDAAFTVQADPATADFFEKPSPAAQVEFGELYWNAKHWPTFMAPGGAANIDIIASTFFWLSGWQEYQIHQRDVHGRFLYESSYQADLDSAMKPVVDVYRLWLADQLKQKGIELRLKGWNGKEWAVALTHDVDFIETRLRSRLKSLFTGRVTRALSRFGKSDPRRHSLYSIHDFEEDRGVTSTFFFKGGATTREDLPYRLRKKWLLRFVDSIKRQGSEVGWHPSYAAYDHPGIARKELNTLQTAFLSDVQSVRTHFLRWHQTVTPRMLAGLGLLVDSSLGFPDQIGFMHGTCHPFKLFDLKTNQPLEVWEVPLVAMDTTLFKYLGLTPEEALVQMKSLFEVIQEVRGCGTVLWHNTIYNKDQFPGQAEVFEQSTDLALQMGAHVGGLIEQTGSRVG